MPHKHKRKRVDDNDKYSDLPPSIIAKPLRPGQKAPSLNSKRTKKAKTSTSSDQWANDTPRAFVHLLQLSRGEKRFAKGPDDGLPPPRKGKGKQSAKPAAPAPAADAPAAAAPPELTIKPGERLSDFAARVDQALPIAGLARKTRGIDGAREERRTKHEKKLLRLQAQWRKDDAAYRERREEAEEAAREAEEEEAAVLGEDVAAEFRSAVAGARKRKGKKLRGADDDDDPWKVLEAKRDRPRGLHDVAEAPPQFKTVPREVLKLKGGGKVMAGDVPRAAGSLKRREELQGERAKVIQAYRDLMNRKRDAP